MTDSLMIPPLHTAEVAQIQFNHLRINSFEPVNQYKVEDTNLSEIKNEASAGGGWTPRAIQMVPYNNQIHSKFG